MRKISYLLIIFIITACSSAPNKKSSTGPYSNIPRSSGATIKGKSNSPASAPPANNNQIIKKADKEVGKKRKFLFDWPVWEARMSRGFMPKGTRRKKRPHYGIDMAGPRGSAVMASHDGVVIYTGKEFRGFGKMIMIETEGGDPEFATLYGHLDKIVVYQGQRVKQGEVIGALGNTGRSSGPHLHFEIRQPNGTPIDPLPMLPAGNELTNEVDDPSAPEE